MMRTIVLLVCVGLALAQELPDWTWDDTTALDAYIRKPDPNYKYELISTVRYDANNEDGIEDCTIHILNMTSQRWQNDNITTQSIWWHHLAISIPDEVRITDTAFMFIGGGSQRDAPPDPEGDVFLDAVAEISVRLGMPGAYLKQIPNQPQYLHQSTEPLRRRSEDALIAWTWRHFIETNGSDPEMVLQFPMTKAAVRAMDTISEYTNKNVSSQFNVTKFLPAGGSKRGWITWLLGCTDRRVYAMSPMVLSILNMVETLGHHYRAYGGWSFAFGDYYRENVTRHLYHPLTQQLANLIDPFRYRARLTMHKIVVQGVADEFFRPDEPNFWFQQLPNPKYLKLMRNAQHALVGSYDNIIDSIVALVRGVNQNIPMPDFSWELTHASDTGRTVVNTNTPPSRVIVWFANSADGDFGDRRRDFRWFIRSVEEPTEVDLNAVFWEESTTWTEDVAERQFSVEFDAPATGWRAFYFELQFTLNDAEGSVFEATTELNVVPNTWPFPFCSNPQECFGDLV